MIKLTTNLEISVHLYNISMLTVNSFKRRAFYRASNSIKNFESPVRDLSDDSLLSIPGVGDSIKDIIKEFIRTGTSARLEDLLKQTNHNFDENIFTSKQISRLVTAKIFNIDQLLGRVKKNKFDDAEICQVIGYKELDKVESSVSILREFLNACASVSRFEVAGSYRRGNKFIKDLDVVVVSSDTDLLISEIDSTVYPIERVNNGTARIRIAISSSIEADLMICKPEEFASTLLYATGSRELNIHMRALAKSKNLTLSQHGVFNSVTEENILASSEQEIFELLGLTYLEPKDR